MRPGGPEPHEAQRPHRFIRGLRHDTGMVLVLFWYGFGTVWYGFGMVLVLFCYDVDMVLVWFGMVGVYVWYGLVWVWYGVGMVLVRFWYGVGIVLL